MPTKRISTVFFLSITTPLVKVEKERTTTFTANNWRTSQLVLSVICRVILRALTWHGLSLGFKSTSNSESVHLPGSGLSKIISSDIPRTTCSMLSLLLSSMHLIQALEKCLALSQHLFGFLVHLNGCNICSHKLSGLPVKMVQSTQIFPYTMWTLTLGSLHLGLGPLLHLLAVTVSFWPWSLSMVLTSLISFFSWTLTSITETFNVSTLATKMSTERCSWSIHRYTERVSFIHGSVVMNFDLDFPQNVQDCKTSVMRL